MSAPSLQFSIFPLDLITSGLQCRHSTLEVFVDSAAMLKLLANVLGLLAGTVEVGFNHSHIVFVCGPGLIEAGFVVCFELGAVYVRNSNEE